MLYTRGAKLKREEASPPREECRHIGALVGGCVPLKPMERRPACCRSRVMLTIRCPPPWFPCTHRVQAARENQLYDFIRDILDSAAKGRIASKKPAVKRKYQTTAAASTPMVLGVPPMLSGAVASSAAAAGRLERGGGTFDGPTPLAMDPMVSMARLGALSTSVGISGAVARAPGEGSDESDYDC